MRRFDRESTVFARPRERFCYACESLHMRVRASPYVAKDRFG